MARQFRDQYNIPPELMKLLSNWRIILSGVVIVVLSASSFFTIETEEVGVVTRFGKYIRTVEPGLQLKIPLMEKVYKIPIERQQKLEFGFKTTKADVRSEFEKGKREREVAIMLTGDLNLTDVEWVVQYRIDNPYNYIFKVRDPESTLIDISEATMRQLVGDRTVNEVITVGRTQLGIELKDLLQKICRDYSLGIKIEQVVLQDVNPPEPVKASFNAVNEAEQEKETLINRAKSERNKVIPKAKGQAEETIQKAKGYATARINRAEGEAARFNAIYSEYVKAPEVTKKRIYLETMSEILPKLGNKIITDENGKNILPLLQMHLKNNENEK